MAENSKERISKNIRFDYADGSYEHAEEEHATAIHNWLVDCQKMAFMHGMVFAGQPMQLVENTPTLEELIERRNSIQLSQEDKGEEAAQRCWEMLGVANRHFFRVIQGDLSLHIVRHEIEACLDRAEKALAK